MKKCGDANPNGNISLFYKGGCREEVDIKNAYRCVGCNGWFHKDCILNHFKLEEKHDFGRQQEKKELRKKLKPIYEYLREIRNSEASGLAIDIELRELEIDIVKLLKEDL